MNRNGPRPELVAHGQPPPARWRLASCCAICLGSLGCANSAATERIFDGRIVVGAYIEPAAYAAYAEGSYLEAQGRWPQAEQAYEKALEYDGDSPSIWTRLGALRCRERLSLALDAFERAARAKDYAPVWLERALCLERHGEAGQALAAAERAVQLDPLSSETNLLIADVYTRQGRPELARAWLFAWTLFSPEAESHWRDVEERAVRLGDGTLASLARAGRARRDTVGEAERPAPRPLAAVDAAKLGGALGSGNLDVARIGASELGLGPVELAVDALSRGEPALAASQAELVVHADPTRGDALVVALFAAASLGDEERLGRLLRLPLGAQLANAELAPLLEDLIRWWVGEDAALAWSAALAASLPPPTQLPPP